MVSNNVIMTMVATAMILLGTALVLYASWMFMMKDTCTCTGQTTLAGGGGQTTVNAASTKEPVTLAPCADASFKRIDQSSPTCYKAITTLATPAPSTNEDCNSATTGSKLASVYTPADNARVQAFIDSQSYNTGFFYVGVKYSGKWVKLDSSALLATDSFFDVGQFEGSGPSAFMKKKGNGFWYQNDGKKSANEGFYILCQL